MSRSRWKLGNFGVRTGELVLTLGLVALSFVMFLGILDLSFPRGTSLRDLLQGDSNLDMRSDGRFDITFDEPEMQEYVAILESVTNRVKDKRPHGIAWRDTPGGVNLSHRHAVQTFSRSAATIVFDGPSRLHLGSDSLVVVRRLEQTPNRARRRASLVMLDGTVRGQLATEPSESMELEILTAKSSSRVTAGPGRNAEFEMVTGEGEETTFSLFEGEAQIEVGGRSVDVNANEFLTISADGKVSAPQRLPSAPALIAPAPERVFAFRSLPPELDFEWKVAARADSYRFEVARDAGFEQLVFQTDTEDASFRHAALEPGEYFWRVSGLIGAANGPSSQAGSFLVVQDQEPPQLEVVFPETKLRASRMLLTGMAEPGAQVYADNKFVELAENGAFELELQLERGLNVLVVEAYDEVGNVSYRSRRIHAEF